MDEKRQQKRLAELQASLDERFRKALESPPDRRVKVRHCRVFVYMCVWGGLIVCESVSVSVSVCASCGGLFACLSQADRRPNIRARTQPRTHTRTHMHTPVQLLDLVYWFTGILALCVSVCLYVACSLGRCVFLHFLVVVVFSVFFF